MFRPVLAIAAAILVASPVQAQPPPASASSAFTVPYDYFTLPNGLKVVVSPDTSAPVVLVEVLYNIGFRVEPKGRTGFAHLFEHMMFQGSANLKKMEHVTLVSQAGGVLNGSTRFDYTNYYEVLPSNALELGLWLEADRMRSLDVSAENLKNVAEQHAAHRGHQARILRHALDGALLGVHHVREAAQAHHDRVMQADAAEIVIHDRFVCIAEVQQFLCRLHARLFDHGDEVHAHHDVLAGRDDRVAVGWREDVVRGEHQHMRFRLRFN
jgi:hypothetical protein